MDHSYPTSPPSYASNVWTFDTQTSIKSVKYVYAVLYIDPTLDGVSVVGKLSCSVALIVPGGLSYSFELVSLQGWIEGSELIGFYGSPQTEVIFDPPSKISVHLNVPAVFSQKEGNALWVVGT